MWLRNSTRKGCRLERGSCGSIGKMMIHENFFSQIRWNTSYLVIPCMLTFAKGGLNKSDDDNHLFFKKKERWIYSTWPRSPPASTAPPTNSTTTSPQQTTLTHSTPVTTTCSAKTHGRSTTHLLSSRKQPPPGSTASPIYKTSPTQATRSRSPANTREPGTSPDFPAGHITSCALVGDSPPSPWQPSLSSPSPPSSRPSHACAKTATATSAFNRTRRLKPASGSST